MIGRRSILAGVLAFEGALFLTSACAEKHPSATIDASDATSSSDATIDAAALDDAALDAALDASAARDASASPGDLADAARTLKQRYRTVLHLGDSEVGFGGGLTKALQRRFEARGIRFFSNSLTSAGLQSYEKEERLARMVKLYNPELVLLNLGTNNLSVPHPDVFVANIRNIVKKISTEGRECIWIGPPHLRAASKREASMTKVIEENVAPCKYFDSSMLQLEMQSDRIHPTDKGGDVWAEQLWRFILVAEAPGGPFRDASAK